MEQRSADLSFYLLGTGIPGGSVRVLREHRIAFAGGQVTLAIIGGSHFLEARLPGQTFSEVLACPRTDLGTPTRPEVGALASWSCRSDPPGLAYRFECWRDQFSLAGFHAEQVRLTVDQPGRMSWLFPRDGAGTGAITCVEWLVGEREVTVATHHTFPGELVIVRSRSVISVPEMEAVGE